MQAGGLVGGRWLLGPEVGRGGMSTVHAATDAETGAPVALKLARTLAGPRGEELQARFRREAEIGRLLEGAPGVVRATGWGTLDGGGLYLVMDLVPGATPLDLTGGRREERLHRLVRAARLVAGVHARGIIHRDIKPANFLVGQDGEARLADFGVSKVLDRGDGPQLPSPALTEAGVQLGSLAFMAPEQLDARLADAKADVYSLGVMLFVALTGRMPFDGAKRSELLGRLRCILDGLARAPAPSRVDPGVPAALDALCARCLDRDPARRPTAEELAKELAPWTQAPGAATRIQGVLGQLGGPRPKKRRPPA